jgi:hypothetical protein
MKTSTRASPNFRQRKRGTTAASAKYEARGPRIAKTSLVWTMNASGVIGGGDQDGRGDDGRSMRGRWNVPEDGLERAVH